MAGKGALSSGQIFVKLLLLFIATTLLPHGVFGQRVKVEPEVSSYPGQTVNLRCAFTDTTGIQLTMVTWIYEPKEGERMNIAVLHPSFDPNYPESPLKDRVSFMENPANVVNPSIQISNVRNTDEGRYICEFASYPSGHEQGATQLVMLRVFSQRVKVEPEVSSYPGQTVNLRCAFTDTTGIQLTMVTWIYEPKEGERMNIAVLHPSFDPNYPESPLKDRVSFMENPANMVNPSIQISNVRMTDEGRYICEFASYPSGHEQGATQLVMLTKPQNSGSALTVEANSKPTVVARCESLNGRPAATIRWVTTANGNATTLSKPGQDNTVSITSEYRVVPTAADNGKDISCIVSHRTQTVPESFQMKLKVQYAPQVTIVGYDNNWYVGRTNVLLTCQAAGNPVPTTILWKSMTGDMPDTVQIKDNQLKVLKVDEAVNTTFVCEVKNRVGIGRDQVTALVREPTVNPSNAGVVAGAVIGSLLALLLVAALVAVLVTRSRRQQQGYRAKGGSDLKSRIFGGGKTANKNGTGGVGGNNNGPIYMYDDGSANQGEKNNHGPLNLGGRSEVVAGTPTAQDILLSTELDDAERRKFDQLEEEERYDHFSGGAPILQLRPPNEQEEMIGVYIDDDMESQRDGSVISRTAVYV